MSRFDQILRHEEILAASFAETSGRRTPQKTAGQPVNQASAAASTTVTTVALLQSQAESVMTREQLYEMFQQIVSVRKYEHQVLFNAMQV